MIIRVDKEELEWVYKALLALYKIDRNWYKRARAFEDMHDSQRARWWALAREQADRGIETHKELVMKVIELRLKS